MVDYEYAKGHDVQDTIRTISLSFQPYLPFTQAYAMALQDQGGGGIAGVDSGRLGYWRFAPKDNPVAQNPKASGRDNNYQYAERRRIYRGEGAGKLAAMSATTNREEDSLQVIPKQEMMGATADLAGELDRLLNADFDRDSFLSSNAKTSGQMHDADELALHMIAQRLDRDISSGKLNSVGDSSFAPSSTTRNPYEATFTANTSRGFDIHLENYKSLNAYLETVMGDAYDNTVRDLEMSTGQAGIKNKKELFRLSGLESKTINEQRAAWLRHIETKINTWNNNINSRFVGMTDMNDRSAFEIVRQSFTPSSVTTSVSHNVRQLSSRFAENRMRPFFMTAPLTQTSMGIIVMRATRTSNGVPNFSVPTVNDVVIVQGTTSLRGGMVAAMIRANTNSMAYLNTINKQLGGLAAGSAISTDATLKSVGKYTEAVARLMSSGELRLSIGDMISEDGSPATLHKVSLDISQKIMGDLNEYYSTGKMKQGLATFYENMLAESNRLTTAWSRNAKRIRGERGKSLSEEFRFGTDWKKGGSGKDMNKKKYLGVWNGASTDAWREDLGYNFSISPMMEARRAGSGGSLSEAFNQGG